MILFLKILGGILALGYGVYLGLAGQFRPDPEELDRALESGGRTRRVKTHFTPLGWLRRTEERASRSRRRERGGARRPFKLSAPDSKEKR